MDYVGRAPMLAFHAPFDRGFLARVTKHYREPAVRQPVAGRRRTRPGTRAQGAADGRWTNGCGTTASRCPSRHSAAADAFATALLMARLLPEARRQGAPDFADYAAAGAAGQVAALSGACGRSRRCADTRQQPTRADYRLRCLEQAAFCSRFQSLSRWSARFSNCRLPLASPISSLIRPLL